MTSDTRETGVTSGYGSDMCAPLHVPAHCTLPWPLGRVTGTTKHGGCCKHVMIMCSIADARALLSMHMPEHATPTCSAVADVAACKVAPCNTPPCVQADFLLQDGEVPETLCLLQVRLFNKEHKGEHAQQLACTMMP